MSQKSSLPQVTQFVSGALPPDIKRQGAASFEAARAAGVIDRLASKNFLLPCEEVPLNRIPSPDGTVYLLEHPRLPFISYPYEWSFSLHRAAALHHIDFHFAALDEGFTLSDSSAYNIQFRGTRPIFIDHLSLRPYAEGMIWEGHRQFCNQFLNPLIMWSWLGVSPNAWFRGSLEGISAEDLAPLLSMRRLFSWTTLTHVVGQAALSRREISGQRSHRNRSTLISKNGLLGILTGLRSFIERLSPPSKRTIWADYASNTTYGPEEISAKREFVGKMVSETRPTLLFDIGCNTGDYSDVALNAGALNVVGLDIDHGALDLAYKRFD
jgi:ribosomal protein L11 methylase PrmA